MQIPIPLQPPLTKNEQLVWIAVRGHNRENPIKKSQIAKKTGLHERKVRNILKHLVEHRGYRIGSTPNRPQGYFVIENLEDARDVCRRYRSQAISILMRERSLRQISIRELVGQVEIDLRSEAKKSE